MKTTQTVSRIALPLLALLALAGCYSVPYEQLEAKRTELRPKLALTPELRTQMAALIMKLDRHDIYFFGKPTFDSARISDVMFDRPLIGALQGTTEQNPHFCVELRANGRFQSAYDVYVQPVGTGFRMRAPARKNGGTAICRVENGGQDFPELVALKNAPNAS